MDPETREIDVWMVLRQGAGLGPQDWRNSTVGRLPGFPTQQKATQTWHFSIPDLATEGSSCKLIPPLDPSLTTSGKPDTNGMKEPLSVSPKIRTQGKHSPPPGPRLPLLPHASDKRTEQREMQLLRRSSQLSLWSPNSPPPSRDIRAGNSGRKIRTSHSKMANKYMIKYSAKLAIRDMNIKP